MHGERSPRSLVNLLVDIIDIFNEALVAVFGIFMVFLKRAVDGILPPARVATTVSAALGIGLFFYVHITGDIPNTLISLTPGRTGDYLQASTTVFLPIVTGAFHLAEDAWATGLFFGALLGLIGGLLIALAPAKRRKHMRKVVREALRLFKMMWSAGWFKSTVRAMSLEVFTTHAS